MNGVCSGCQRRELHKMCPAYGTPFYMSGVPFTIEIEIEIKNRMSNQQCECGGSAWMNIPDSLCIMCTSCGKTKAYFDMAKTNEPGASIQGWLNDLIKQKESSLPAETNDETFSEFRPTTEQYNTFISDPDDQAMLDSMEGTYVSGKIYLPSGLEIPEPPKSRSWYITEGKIIEVDQELEFLLDSKITDPYDTFLSRQSDIYKFKNILPECIIIILLCSVILLAIILGC